MKKIKSNNGPAETRQVLTRAQLKDVVGGNVPAENPGDRERACFAGCAEEAGAVARGNSQPGVYEMAYAACLSMCIGSGSPTMPDPWKGTPGGWT